MIHLVKFWSDWLSITDPWTIRNAISLQFQFLCLAVLNVIADQMHKMEIRDKIFVRCFFFLWYFNLVLGWSWQNIFHYSLDSILWPICVHTSIINLNCYCNLIFLHSQSRIFIVTNSIVPLLIYSKPCLKYAISTWRIHDLCKDWEFLWIIDGNWQFDFPASSPYVIWFWFSSMMGNFSFIFLFFLWGQGSLKNPDWSDERIG